MTFDFELPPQLIAKYPSPGRSDARMLVYERESKRTTHTHVKTLPEWLRADDTLVLNQAKVDPVRIQWTWKNKTEEIVLLKCIEDIPGRSVWEAIVSGKKIPLETELPILSELSFRLVERKEQGIAVISINRAETQVRDWIEVHGLMPIPPYIRKQRGRFDSPENSPEDAARYQTVFAQRKGAVAAPTAGLHFTPELLQALKNKGVDIQELFLAVGWGTFEPLTEKHWTSGKLHQEYVEIPPRTAQAVKRAVEEKKRVIAVGTTVVRSLEWWAAQGASEEGAQGHCDIFLRPPWRSAILSGMLTNFHLSQTSLLTLVGAFLGEKGDEVLKKIYQEAIALNYRFFSYGDCMLIL